MSKVSIAGLPTGVPGLDDIIGGDGLPEFSFNLIAGPPGSGKTTLAQQIMFHNATEERPALFFTVLGEPPIKMIRYMQQFAFFDMAKVEKAVRFVNLGEEALSQDLETVLARIVAEVNAVQPGIVVVDSFRTAIRSATGPNSALNVEGFVQRLALHLTSWQATTFLIGEYQADEVKDNPVFTVADSLIWMWQGEERNSVVRRLKVTKMRGRAPMPGLHTFRIAEQGVRLFPRTPHTAETPPIGLQEKRLSTGLPALDEMMDGGIVRASSVLVAGPAGSGKTALVSHFLEAAGKAREPTVVAIFEESPDQYVRRAADLGIDLGAMVDKGLLRIISSRPLDLSVDETLFEVRQAIESVRASRVVIDSLSGFELAVAPPFQQEFRESLYRMMGQLTSTGITVMMTCEVVESFTDIKFTPHAISFLTDVIIVQRYVELAGTLKKVMAIAKMRNSTHSDALRRYKVGPRGIELGETMSQYRGVVTGVPNPTDQERLAHPGLNLQELLVLQALIALGPAPAPAIAARVQLGEKELQAALSRLGDLHYAEQETAGGQTLYRIGKVA